MYVEFWDIAKLWLMLTFVELCWLPFSWLLLNKLTDTAKLVFANKLLAVGLTFLLYFNLAGYQLIKLADLWLVVIPLTVSLVAVLRLYRTGQLAKLYTRKTLTTFVASALLMLFAMLVWYLLRSPGWQIKEVERYMDYGIIEAVRRTASLPLIDFWLSGEKMNYYYFGHFIAGKLFAFTNVATDAGMLILPGWLFATSTSMIFATVGENVAGSRKRKLFAGALSAVVFAFAGTLSTIPRLLVESFGGESYYFWSNSREIAGTIIEPTFFTFLLAELHAHMWGIWWTTLVLFLITLVPMRQRSLSFADGGRRWSMVLTLAFGISYLLNSWDVLVVVAVLSCFLFANFQRLKLETKLLELGKIIVPIAIGAVAVSFVWTKDFHAPVSGISFVRSPSAVSEWLTVWGLAFALIVAAAVVSRKRQLSAYLIALIVPLLLFWVFVEVFYVRDIAADAQTWYRFNTVFKISVPLAVLVALISGPIIVSLSKRILLLILPIFLMAVSFAPIAWYQEVGVNLDRPKYSSGLQSWAEQRTTDFQIYSFLHGQLSVYDRPVILQAVGEAYSRDSLISTFLGAQTVIGWVNHQRTWRGEQPELYRRVDDVDAIYQTSDQTERQRLLAKYSVDYIVISTSERSRYGAKLQLEQLAELGTITSFGSDSFLIKL